MPKESLSKEAALQKKLLSNLDVVFKKYIRKRDKYKCILSGEARNLTLSHFFGRKGSNNQAMTYDERNVHLMSLSRHEAYHMSNPLPYYRWMLEQYGEEVMVEMERLSRKTKTLSTQEIIEMTNMYVRKIQALGNIRRWNEFNSKKKVPNERAI